MNGDRVKFTITADRFLRNMVRSITGTLLETQKNIYEPGIIEQILEREDRTAAGVSVPAHGLYLLNIVYPFQVDDQKER